MVTSMKAQWRSEHEANLHFEDHDLESRDASQQEFTTCEISKCQHVELSKCKVAKSTRDPVLVIQRCWILGNLIEGLLFHLTVN
jgi:hypothetical protein